MKVDDQHNLVINRILMYFGLRYQCVSPLSSPVQGYVRLYLRYSVGEEARRDP